MALPENPGPARDAYILDAVRAGRLEHAFVPITSSIPGHTATFYVFQDAGKVDGVRVGVGARVLQLIADHLGCLFLTPKLQDLAYAQARPQILPWLDYNPTKMQSTAWFKRATDGIDKLITQAGGKVDDHPVSSMGKPWQLTNLLLDHPGRAINYGLYVPESKTTLQNGKRYYFGVYAAPALTIPHVYVLQDPGWAHTLDQDDYSETVVLVRRDCVVDNVVRDLADVLRDPALAPLASHEGVLRVLRQPRVPLESCKIALPVGGGGPGENPNTTLCKPPPSPLGAYGSAPTWPAWKTALVAGGVVATTALAAAAIRRRRLLK